MFSKSFFSFMFPITVQCELILSFGEPESKDSKLDNANQSISLSELVSTFRDLPDDTADNHLTFMLWVASYGDHLYSLPVELSAECWRTARASSLMLEKLATLVEAFALESAAVNSALHDLHNRTELQEHPLELVCRGIEKLYAQSNLSSLFEKAKKDAANFQSMNRRPPYFLEILKTDELMLKIVEKSDIPEFAQHMALRTFGSLVHNFRPRRARRWTYLARTCRAVAQKDGFADSMQNIFEKVINDVLPEIMATDRVEKYQSSSPESYWEGWISSMVKAFYGYIAKDPILKKEVDDVARLVGKDASHVDLDFSII